MTGRPKKRKKEPGMKSKATEGKKVKIEQAERIDKVWDLVSDLNPY